MIRNLAGGEARFDALILGFLLERALEIFWH
jgi:hypothetical protein